MLRSNGTTPARRRAGLKRLLGRFLSSDVFREPSGLARAVYLLLLVHQWTARGRRLPAEEGKLCALCGLEESDWERVRDQVLPLFEIIEEGGEVSLRALPLETVSSRRGQTGEEEED